MIQVDRSDWGSGPNGTQTFNTSIAQWISTNVDNQDEGTGSITGIKNGGGTAADLINSGLAWNATTNKSRHIQHQSACSRSYTNRFWK